VLSTIINQFESYFEPERLIIAQRKRKVILLHDNARSHVTKVVKGTLSALQ